MKTCEGLRGFLSEHKDESGNDLLLIIE